MPVTLTDEQVAELRARLGQAETNAKIAEATAKIWNDPERGERAKALWKEQYPDTDLGPYDVERRINERLDKERLERQQAEKAAREKEQDERLAKKRSETKDRYGATDDAMERLERMMVERNIGDYDVAAEHFFTREPRVSDGTQEYESQFWRHDQKDLFKEISEDPEAWGRKEIMKTLRDQERQERGGWR